MQTQKNLIRTNAKNIYSQDLLNNIFKHPYTKIEFVMKDLGKGRITAAKYLSKLCDLGVLQKVKLGKENFYIHTALFELFRNI